MKTSGNVQIERIKSSSIIRFPGPRNVLSTSWLNGGYREDLTAVFNHQISKKACNACHSGGSIRTYLAGVAVRCGLDPRSASGLVTRAEMKNAMMVTESFRDLSVCAIVTAGIDKNGGRAGDPASYYENGDAFEPVGGTVNTILVISADLPEYAMARAMMTATEAKAAALQQLMAKSIYSTGIATGSGTDMIAIISDPASQRRLSDAGKHSALGELIGTAVIRATAAALEKETGLSPRSQCDALIRLSRYRVTERDLWIAAAEDAGKDVSGTNRQERFYRQLERWAKRPGSVALVAAALHIVDEEAWGLIPRKEACGTICRILQAGSVGGGGARIPEDTPVRCLTVALADLICRTSYRCPAPPERNTKRPKPNVQKRRMT